MQAVGKALTEPEVHQPQLLLRGAALLPQKKVLRLHVAMHIPAQHRASAGDVSTAVQHVRHNAGSSDIRHPLQVDAS